MHLAVKSELWAVLRRWCCARRAPSDPHARRPFCFLVSPVLRGPRLARPQRESPTTSIRACAGIGVLVGSGVAVGIGVFEHHSSKSSPFGWFDKKSFWFHNASVSGCASMRSDLRVLQSGSRVPYKSATWDTGPNSVCPIAGVGGPRWADLLNRRHKRFALCRRVDSCSIPLCGSASRWPSRMEPTSRRARRRCRSCGLLIARYAARF